MYGKIVWKNNSKRKEMAQSIPEVHKRLYHQ